MRYNDFDAVLLRVSPLASATTANIVPRRVTCVAPFDVTW